MRTKPALTAADAAIIVAACKAEAAKNSWPVTIVVVDEAGILLHLERMDGAGLQSPEVATLKARTSAMTKAPTKALEDVVTGRPTVGSIPGRVTVQGGVPILYQGECVGAIGVSGVKSSEDEDVAVVGLNALMASLG
ncbi:MAG: hypothetical protein JWM33_941 [Caulobacteraceae bacterium]|nr:hypothetical protein [Caulobacteraceae bacterium]